MRAPMLIALFVIGCGDPCGGIDGTCIGLTVQGASTIDLVRVALSGKTQGHGDTPLAGHQLPVSLALHLRTGEAGLVHIDVSGFSNELVVANGATDVSVPASAHVDTSVSLASVTSGAGPDLATSTDDGGAADLACTSTLTDPHNCGSCGHDCLGGACQNGVCQPQLVVDGTALAATALTIDGNGIYLADRDSSRELRQMLTGGAPTPITTTGSQVAGLAVASGVLYGTVSASNTVWMLSLAGASSTSAPQTFASAQSSPQGIAVDGQSPPNVYWANSSNGTIERKSTANGSTATSILSGLSAPSRVAVDSAGQTVYWIDNSQRLWRSVIGSNMNSLVSGVPTGVNSVAVDDTAILWTYASGGSVQSMPLGGGAVTTLASTQSSPNAIAIDATSVYWCDGSGHVLRVAR